MHTKWVLKLILHTVYIFPSSPTMFFNYCISPDDMLDLCVGSESSSEGCGLRGRQCDWWWNIILRWKIRIKIQSLARQPSAFLQGCWDKIHSTYLFIYSFYRLQFHVAFKVNPAIRLIWQLAKHQENARWENAEENGVLIFSVFRLSQCQFDCRDSYLVLILK